MGYETALLKVLPERGEVAGVVLAAILLGGCATTYAFELAGNCRGSPDSRACRELDTRCSAGDYHSCKFATDLSVDRGDFRSAGLYAGKACEASPIGCRSVLLSLAQCLGSGPEGGLLSSSIRTSCDGIAKAPKVGAWILGIGCKANALVCGPLGEAYLTGIGVPHEDPALGQTLLERACYWEGDACAEAPSPFPGASTLSGCGFHDLAASSCVALAATKTGDESATLMARATALRQSDDEGESDRQARRREEAEERKAEFQRKMAGSASEPALTDALNQLAYNAGYAIGGGRGLPPPSAPVYRPQGDNQVGPPQAARPAGVPAAEASTRTNGTGGPRPGEGTRPKGESSTLAADASSSGQAKQAPPAQGLRDACLAKIDRAPIRPSMQYGDPYGTSRNSFKGAQMTIELCRGRGNSWKTCAAEIQKAYLQTWKRARREQDEFFKRYFSNDPEEAKRRCPGFGNHDTWATVDDTCSNLFSEQACVEELRHNYQLFDDIFKTDSCLFDTVLAVQKAEKVKEQERECHRLAP